MDMPATAVESPVAKASEDPASATPSVATPRRSGRLFRKYFILILALVTGALLIPSSISLYFSYRETLNALHSVQQEKAIAAASRIQQYIVQVQNQLSNVSLPQLGAARTEEQRIEFLRLLKQVPARHRRLLHRRGRLREDAGLAARNGRERRMPARPVGRSGVQAAHCRDRPITVPCTSGRKPSRTCRSPCAPALLRRPVTIADVNLKFLWDVITQIRIGEKGKAYVVDASGYLIADPDIGLVLRKTDLSGLAHIHAALAAGGAAMPVAVTRDAGGGEVLTAYASVDPLGWKVFVEQPASEVLARLDASIWRTGGMLLGGLVISALAALFLARGMARPIRTLQEGAQLIGAGKLDQEIDGAHRRRARSARRTVQRDDRAASRVLCGARAQGRRAHRRAQEFAGAADRDQRDPARDLGFADRRAAGARRGRRARRAPVRCAVRAGASSSTATCSARRRARCESAIRTRRYDDPDEMRRSIVPLQRDFVVGRAVHRPRDDHYADIAPVARHRVPGRAPVPAALRLPRAARRAADARRRRLRRDPDLASRAAAVPARPDRAARDLRAPGRDRDRQRAAVQRDEGSARPAARVGRGALGDQQLDRRRGAGVRRDPRRVASGCSPAHTSA